MRSHPPTESAPLRTTLLDLVTRLTDVTADEDETVRAALALLDSGQAELTGNFRGQRLALPGAA